MRHHSDAVASRVHHVHLVLDHNDGAAEPVAHGADYRTPYGQKIETAQRRQRSNIFGLGPVLHNKLAVDA
jgi:hypothetical protein